MGLFPQASSNLAAPQQDEGIPEGSYQVSQRPRGGHAIVAMWRLDYRPPSLEVPFLNGAGELATY